MPLQRGADFVPDRFSGLVRQALENGVITMSRAAEMMGMDLREMREYYPLVLNTAFSNADTP